MSATISELQQALDDNPESWHCRLQLVEAMVAGGRHESAVEVVNEGHAIPREPGPWLDAAKCYGAVGALEQARGLTASSLEIDEKYEPALTYMQELDAAIAAAPVALSAEDVEDVEDEASAEAVEVVDEDSAAAASPPPPTSAPPAPTIHALAEDADHDEPIALPRVSFENHEMEALLAAEEESKRINEQRIRRDKMNSVIITVVLHVLIFLGLISIATKTPPNVPPQIVAASAPEQSEEMLEEVKLEKPTVDPTTATNSAVADIISVNAESNISISNLDVPIADVAMQNVVSFNPSMSLGMPTSTESKMMFGQPMDGDVLGVILDVSGSMAEYLPMVVREVDKNFEDSPVVYVRNMLIRSERPSDEASIRLIYPEEVIPYNKELKTRTPYWFLWHDLPRKAPQRYVDRLIETFKTRPNQFISVGGWNSGRTSEAIDFLMEQGIDSLYIFSDFEDFVDEDIALTLGQKLGRRKIKTYIQPAEKGTEYLDIMTKKIASRTLGRQMPALVSILSGGGVDDEPDSLLPSKPEKKSESMEVDFEFTHAKPRPEITSQKFYGFTPNANWTELHRLSEPEYDAVFYGPEARAYIFLKNEKGEYIQNPISFFYHSWKEFPDHPDPRYRVRRRKFLRVEEEPKFDGKDFTWKMILEDEVKFEVQLYLNTKGMAASYSAEIPEEGTGDNPYVYFRIPGLARENKDRYFGHDFPDEGVKLDDVRKVVHDNEVIMDLPRELRDSRGKGWSQLGFEPGYNTRNFDTLIRHFPSGIRDMKIQGPSFGPRLIHFRTTSNKVLLSGGAGRADIEPWESFWGAIRRPNDRREGFRKSEAIQITIK